MKLNVKFVEKRISSRDPFKEMANNVDNHAAKVVAKELKKRLAKAECGVHKEGSKGTIKIIAGDKMKVEKSNFCCEEFKNSINITG
jgi:hypothetical protein